MERSENSWYIQFITTELSIHSEGRIAMKENKLIELSKMFAVDMYDKCSKIRKLLISSINTAKGNL